MDNTHNDAQFVREFNHIATKAHANSRAKGFWNDKDLLASVAQSHSPGLAAYAEAAIISSEIALIQSEASEALENVRGGFEPDDKVPEFMGIEAELADVVIRIMDMAAGRGFRVGAAIIAKMAMNATRPPMHGGKAL